MESFFRELVSLPIPFLLGALIAFLLGRGRKGAHRLLGVVVLGFWVAATPVAGDWLARGLAAAVPEPTLGDTRFDFVLVPTAGHFHIEGLGRWPSQGTLARYASGLAVADALALPLVVSGGDPAGIGASEARALVTRSPPPPGLEVRVDPSPRNTLETARSVASMGTAPPGRVLVVTSCAHTLRTAAMLRAHGVQVRRAGESCRAGAAHTWRDWLPTGAGLSTSARVWHEVVGIAWALLQGHIGLADLAPGPIG